ncbi:hypothetical protein EXU85_04970 [Spirosoma sp. KCTC 42546]|uniref:hypothetical protein n=1 Tax=Spirosoma sp. KCTC 42546 TaxID=2520506 RepID=UPI001156D795|nr:hypothetical protein [Spirosoma sp. KCTC 42546]QDK77976.1 hypothetical protein EXU85_04970 [Spirosoma sp. KCTC 42546]
MEQHHDALLDITETDPNDTTGRYSVSPSLLAPPESTRLIDLPIQPGLLDLPAPSPIGGVSVHEAGVTVSVKCFL